MRFRSVVTAASIVGLAIAAQVPATAQGATQTTYYAAECSVGPTGGTVAFTGKNGKIAHFRDFVNSNDVWVWNAGTSSWQLAGTDVVTINFNGEISKGVTAWGDFLLTLEGVNAWRGQWAWGAEPVGHGAGNAVAGTSHLNIYWTRVQPPEWGVAPFPGCSQPGQTYIFMRLDATTPAQ
jgi:hypothetical protein